jgi:hypothetical protein
LQGKNSFVSQRRLTLLFGEELFHRVQNSKLVNLFFSNILSISFYFLFSYMVSEEISGRIISLLLCLLGIFPPDFFSDFFFFTYDMLKLAYSIPRCVFFFCIYLLNALWASWVYNLALTQTWGHSHSFCSFLSHYEYVITLTAITSSFISCACFSFLTLFFFLCFAVLVISTLMFSRSEILSLIMSSALMSWHENILLFCYSVFYL